MLVNQYVQINQATGCIAHGCAALEDTIPFANLRCWKLTGHGNTGPVKQLSAKWDPLICCVRCQSATKPSNLSPIPLSHFSLPAAFPLLPPPLL